MFKTIVSVIFRILLIALSIVFAIAETIALFAPIIRPDNSISVTQILTMAEPALIAVNILLFLIWAILWSKWSFLPLLVLIFSVGRIDSYFSYRLSRSYDVTDNTRKKKEEIKLMSYNVKGFGYTAPGVDSVLRSISSFDPDILCLVEYAPQNASAQKLREVFPKLKYHADANGTKGDLPTNGGIVILSKYPLLHPENYNFQQSQTALMADAVLDYGDTLRVFGLHLETTGYNGISSSREFETYMADSTLDRSDILGSIRSDSNRLILRNKTLRVLHTLSANAHNRSLQADTIRQKIELSPYRTLIMGDFNDTPYSYAVRTIQSSDHLDPFVEIPRNRYGYSYNRLHGIFRIDFILPQKNSYEVLEYDSSDCPVSDHNPVMAIIRRRY